MLVQANLADSGLTGSKDSALQAVISYRGKVTMQKGRGMVTACSAAASPKIICYYIYALKSFLSKK